MKEYKIGKARVKVRSNLLDMTKEERRDWYRDELAKENPILKEIANAVNDCYKRR